MASEFAGTKEESLGRPSLIEWLTFGKVGDSNTGAAFRKVQNVPETVRIEDTGTYVYMGWAIPGSAEADAVWRIARVDTSGNKLYADGDALYNNIWNNRASLSYA